MSMRAAGTFTITMKPQPPYDSAEGIVLARASIDKTFVGDLEATSVVEMMSAMTPVPGSAGYVALERVRGTLLGRSGTFVLQHSGSMTRGQAAMTVTVVPDSGTGELTGLAGTLLIEIVDGKHFYTFNFQLDQPL